MMHLGSIDDLTNEDVNHILDRAEALRCGAELRLRPRQVLSLAFFQSSTRTRVGFAAAGIRLGMGPVDLWAERYDEAMSSPESLADTIRVVTAYSDVMVFRHPSREAWAEAVAVAQCPLINCGNSGDEHPTQALIDGFAIRRAFGRLDGLRVGIVGDVAGSRSAHSLMRLLARFRPSEVRLMGPESRVGGAVADSWVSGPARSSVSVVHELDVRELDVVYFAGLPEGEGSGRLATSVRRRFMLTRERLQVLPDSAIVLCPLPRVDEIARELDRDARCRHFAQSDGGGWLRMAILERRS